MFKILFNQKKKLNNYNKEMKKYERQRKYVRHPTREKGARNRKKNRSAVIIELFQLCIYTVYVSMQIFSMIIDHVGFVYKNYQGYRNELIKLIGHFPITKINNSLIMFNSLKTCFTTTFSYSRQYYILVSCIYI